MQRDYKEVSSCEHCSKAFGLTRIRHKCKRCKLIICADCGPAKSIIIGYKKKPAVPHRICQDCNKDVSYQKKFRTEFEGKWAVKSRLGHDWYCDADPDKNLGVDMKVEYQRCLEQSYKNLTLQKTIVELMEDLKAGKGDREMFNYSLTEQMYYLQGDMKSDYIRRNIENVLRAYYAKYLLTHCNIMILVAGFLLCCCDEKTAFGLICYLHEKVLPQDFWNRTSEPMPFMGVEYEKYIMRRMIENKLNLTSDMKPKFRKAYKKIADYMIGALLIDILNFESLIYVFTELFKKGELETMETFWLRIMIDSEDYFATCSTLPIKNYQIYCQRKFFSDRIKKLDHITFDKNLCEEYSFELDSGEFDDIISKQNCVVALNELLGKMTVGDLAQIKFELSSYLEQYKKEQHLKAVPFSAPLNFDKFASIIKNKTSLKTSITDEQLNDMWNALDFYYQDHVESSFILSYFLIQVVPGSLEVRFGELYSTFSKDKKKNSDPKASLPIIDLFSEIVALMNVTKHNLLLWKDLFQLREKIRKKYKKQKMVSHKEILMDLCSSQLVDIVNDSQRNPLKKMELMSDRDRCNTMDVFRSKTSGNLASRQTMNFSSSNDFAKSFATNNNSALIQEEDEDEDKNEERKNSSQQSNKPKQADLSSKQRAFTMQMDTRINSDGFETIEDSQSNQSSPQKGELKRSNSGEPEVISGGSSDNGTNNNNNTTISEQATTANSSTVTTVSEPEQTKLKEALKPTITSMDQQRKATLEEAKMSSQSGTGKPKKVKRYMGKPDMQPSFLLSTKSVDQSLTPQKSVYPSRRIRLNTIKIVTQKKQEEENRRQEEIMAQQQQMKQSKSPPRKQTKQEKPKSALPPQQAKPPVVQNQQQAQPKPQPQAQPQAQTKQQVPQMQSNQQQQAQTTQQAVAPQQAQEQQQEDVFYNPIQGQIDIKTVKKNPEIKDKSNDQCKMCNIF